MTLRHKMILSEVLSDIDKMVYATGVREVESA